LFVRRGVSLLPLIYGGGQERGRRSGTENTPFAGALALALMEAQSGVEERVRLISHVRNYLLEEIKKKIPGVVLHGASGDTRVANNINISIPGLNGDLCVVALSSLGVAASTRSACDTDEDAPSHVLAAIGVSPEQAKNSIRLTLLPTVTKRDARQIVEALVDIVARYRQK